MERSDIPQSTDYYDLLHLTPNASIAQIEARLTRVEDHLRAKEWWIHQEGVYIRDAFETRIAEARLVLLNQEKRAEYDGIHSGIEVVWLDHEKGHFGRREQLADATLATRIAEILSDDHTGQAQGASDARSPKDSDKVTATMVDAGATGCSTCWESAPDPTAAYKYCSECGYGMHDTCWIRWRNRCLLNELPASCAHCRRRVVD